MAQGSPETVHGGPRSTLPVRVLHWNRTGYVNLGPPRALASRIAGSDERPCCCVGVLPWPRAINSPRGGGGRALFWRPRNAVSRGSPERIYRPSGSTSLPAIPSLGVVTTPETSPSAVGRDARPRVRAKPELPALLKPCAAADTLDRLQRFRFGRGGRTRHNRPSRTGDRADSLRELTERLKGATGSNAPPTPPPLPPPVPPPRTRALRSPPTTPPQQQTSSVQQDDAFDVHLSKPESRAIIGAYIQRTIPFRSASFSQVDYLPDGKKYVRNSQNPRVASESVVAGAGLTLPRKREGVSPNSKIAREFTSSNDLSTNISDSLLKSSETVPNETCVSNALSEVQIGGDKQNNISIIPVCTITLTEDKLIDEISSEIVCEKDDLNENDIVKSLNIKNETSVFNTFPKRKHSMHDDLPYTSIDAENLKSLRNKRDEIESENYVSNRNCLIDTSSSEPVVCEDSKIISINSQDTNENNVHLTEDTSPESQETSVLKPDVHTAVLTVVPVPVYECIVREWSSSASGDTEQWAVATPTLITCDSIKSDSPSSDVSVAEERKRVVDKSKRRKGIYITQWPSQDTDVTEDLNECKSSVEELVEDPKTEDHVEESKIEWRNESSDDKSNRSTWSPRPPLSCQTSEEKEEDHRKIFNRRMESLSDGESDQGASSPGRDHTTSPSPSPFDLSDSENKPTYPPRRYSKRPLRGPYGQMLEAEMKKPEASKFSKMQYNEELKFLEELISPKQQNQQETRAARVRQNNRSFDASHLTSHAAQQQNLTQAQVRPAPKRKPVQLGQQDGGLKEPSRTVFHQRTASSPSQLENPRSPPEPSAELLAELLRGSSERLCTDTGGLDGIPACVQKFLDTRTHVVVELFDTERSYVEALQILVLKYLQPLQSPEHAGLVDSSLVDEIFYMVPAILAVHEKFLEELRKRLEVWDAKQKVGDVFLDAFSNPSVMETYTGFINNWKKAKEAIKSTSAARPAFARFLEAMARENKGKLALDNLLIKPVQKFPRYELLLQRLIKHTDTEHPDHKLLLDAQRQVHDLLVKINCTERETLEYEQQQNTLREIENLVEGLNNLVSPERSYIRHDLVSMHAGQGARKERALFLFSDLLIITSIKRRSGTIRKPTTACPGSIASTLDANKYKLLLRIALDDLEIMKVKDESVRRAIREIEFLSADLRAVQRICELAGSLRCPHSALDDVVREMQASLSRQLADRQIGDTQLSYLEMTINVPNGIENISVVFSKPEKRSGWEEAFNDAKQKLALLADRRPTPEFVTPVPIRKTRAGLQFTCAAPTLGFSSGPHGENDVWVCNSDGYVGQVCVLSLHPEPTVASCNGVCNARILCVASVPAASSESSKSLEKLKTDVSISVEDTEKLGNIHLDSDTSSDDEDYVSEGVPELEHSSPPSPEPRKSPIAVSEETIGGGDCLMPTMWLGTEDGCIHVYNCTDNIRTKKNKIKIQHGSAVYCIIYLDDKVFVSFANGDISVYTRDQTGWNTNEPTTVCVGSNVAPITKLLPVVARIWCSAHNHIKILNIESLQIETTFQISTDINKPITNMVFGNSGVWISLQNSAVLKCYHANTYECLLDVNIAPSVTKMLAACDDIIRQHKAACLRVTALLACKDLLWIGTSAGVILTMPMPHIGMLSFGKLPSLPNVSGVPHGHTGHVRFLTYVEHSMTTMNAEVTERQPARNTAKVIGPFKCEQGNSQSISGLVISGGDGYEDFRNVGASEVAGREDSTNHLLLWQV